MPKRAPIRCHQSASANHSVASCSVFAFGSSFRRCTPTKIPISSSRTSPVTASVQSTRGKTCASGSSRKKEAGVKVGEAEPGSQVGSVSKLLHLLRKERGRREEDKDSFEQPRMKSQGLEEELTGAVTGGELGTECENTTERIQSKLRAIEGVKRGETPFCNICNLTITVCGLLQ